VNADLIARGLAGFNPNSAAAAAGRIMLRRLDELAAAQLSFAFETTGASRSFARRIASWKRTGYRFLLTFVWVENSSISIERVARRVQLGGHDVPAETIRRRYHRRLVNLFDLCCPIADGWQLLDNSGIGNAILVAEGGTGRTQVIHEEDTWKRIIRATAMARTEC
jgi:predicted ABC-type ATPase